MKFPEHVWVDMASEGGSSGSTTLAYFPHYFSTPCIHRLHEQCKGKCKFCESPCRCSCHQEKP